MTKITLTFEGDATAAAKLSLKLDLPVKWMDGPVSRVVDTFCAQYNKKHPSSSSSSAALSPTDVHLVAEKQSQIIPLDANVGQITSHLGGAFLLLRGKRDPQQQQQPEEEDDDEEEAHVASKKALDKAKLHAFDYSKWDKLDLSDDDGLDCHPNIELASWKRIKAQQRAERRQKEDAEVKRLEAKLAEFRAQNNSSMITKYEHKLAEFNKTRKWVAEDVCDTKEDRSVVAAGAPPTTAPAATKVVGPVNPDQDFYETYESFVQANEPLLRKFASMDGDKNRQASQEFLEAHPQLVHKHSDGFLLLLCLDVAMRKEQAEGDGKLKQSLAKELRRTVQQHLQLNYILELAKLSHVEDTPMAAVRPFYAKTQHQSKEQLEDYGKELSSFISRIENRAKEKLGKGERSPLAPKPAKEEEEEDEEEYEKAEPGPGGLDPTEVLQSLPKDMQEAFVDQDVPKLKLILSEMDAGEANYHLKRCIDSGLWVVPPRQPGEPEDNSDQEEEEQD